MIYTFLDSTCKDIFDSIWFKIVFLLVGSAILFLNVASFSLKCFVDMNLKERVFLNTLCISNSLMGCYFITIGIIDTLFHKNHVMLNNILLVQNICRIVGALPMTSLLMSTSILGCISVIRLIVIKYYVKQCFRNIQAKRNHLLPNLIFWVLSIIVAIYCTQFRISAF